MESKAIFGPVSCGFNKWSVAINEYGQLVINYSYDPIYGDLTLSDMSEKDLEKLVDLFSAALASIKLSKHVKGS